MNDFPSSNGFARPTAAAEFVPPLATSAAPPYFVTLDCDCLDLANSDRAAFTVFPSPFIRNEPLLLVIDLYRSDAPRHPEGHVGYWSCPLHDGRPIGVELRRRKGRLQVEFSGAPICDRWVNEDGGGAAGPLLTVHVALYSATGNRVLFVDGIFLHQDRDRLQRDWEARQRVDAAPGWSAAAPSFRWPADSRLLLATPDIRVETAVGNFALDIRRLALAHDIPCQIFARHFDPTLRGPIRPMTEILARAATPDLLLLQYSLHDPDLEALAALPCRKILFFQNVTPAQFFQRFDAHFAREQCHRALAQLQTLPPFDALLANSQRSADDLRDLLANGQRRFPTPPIRTCPPLLGVRRWDRLEAEPIGMPPARTRLLYVGRLAPHKKIEDLIGFFAEYLRLDGDTVLLLAGEAWPSPYESFVRNAVRRLPAEYRGRVHFLGRVSDGQLKTLYAASSALVTMSEHEGFCVPLVEAMVFDLPIFAYADPAITETLGGGGTLFSEKNGPAVARLVRDVLHDPARRARTIAAQRRRLAELAALADGRRLWEIFAEVLNGIS